MGQGMGHNYSNGSHTSLWHYDNVRARQIEHTMHGTLESLWPGLASL